ncbi:MAG: hypothetical protein AAF442_07020 [Pseudomonadota bacterium]
MIVPIEQIKVSEHILHHYKVLDVLSTISKDGSQMWVWLGNESGYYFRVYGAYTNAASLEGIDMEDCSYKADALFWEWHEHELRLLEKYCLPSIH